MFYVNEMKTFYTLRDALDALQLGLKIFAVDTGITGKKKFCLTSEEDVRKTYATLFKNKGSVHWYEVLLSGDHPTRLFLDVESYSHTRANVIRAIDSFLALINMCTRVVSEGESDKYFWLDSCREGKASFHIVGTLYFASVAAIGALVRTCWCSVQEIVSGRLPAPDGVDKDALSFLREETGESIVDCIYTRNRVFRLPFSSKFASPHVLMPMEGRERHASWDGYLVQKSYSAMSTTEALIVLEIDGSVPLYTNRSFADTLARPNDASGWIIRDVCAANSSKLSTGSNPLLSPVLRRLDEMGYMLKHETLVFSPQRRGWLVNTNSKRCNIAQREHKGNHIWFFIELGVVKQYCYDHECRGCAEIDVGDAWDKWMSLWNVMISGTSLLNSVRR